MSQIIVRSKQPMKIDKSFQSLLTFSHSAFFSFYFLNALQSDILRAHFNPRLAARPKMSLSRAQNIFMPKNINSIFILLLISNLAYVWSNGAISEFRAKQGQQMEMRQRLLHSKANNSRSFHFNDMETSGPSLADQWFWISADQPQN